MSSKKSVFEAYERIIHDFLELGRHETIVEYMKTSFKPIRGSHFAAYIIEIAVFCSIGVKI